MGCQDSGQPGRGVETGQEKTAIVLVAFGTSVATARQVYAHIDAQARKRYPDYELRWAFTSQFIIDKLKKEGIVTHNVGEVVDELRRDGYARIAFQSLHVAPGEEYRRVLQVDMSGLEVAYGDALLTSVADIDAVALALGADIDPLQPTVIVSHGNENYPQFNEQLLALARVLEARYPQLVVASVEGEPGTAPLRRIRALCAGGRRVRFVPLMIVAGDHILNDVMGDDTDSWKSQVQAGAAECRQPLGWNDAVLEIYFRHLDSALASLVKG